MARYPELSLTELDSADARFSLTSTDFDLYAETFELCDREGGGYDWECVAEYLVQSEPRRLAKKISFDSEAGMFCALSDSHRALEWLSGLLRHTFRSKQRLKEAIRESSASEEMDSPEKTSFDTVVVIRFNRYIYDEHEELERLLETELPKEHLLVYCPRGAGEDIFYIRTNDRNAAVKSIKPLLKKVNLLKTSTTIGWAPRDVDEYTVLWPKNRKKKLVPKNELCPTVP